MQNLCKKGVLLVNSMLITIIGIGMAAVGGVLRFHTEMLNGYLTILVKLIPSGGFIGTDVWTLYNYTAIALIMTGIIVGGLGILGCWIATCPQLVLIIVHMVIVCILIIGQILIACMILTMKIPDGIQEPLKDNLIENYAGDVNVTDESSIAWNYMFVEFSCCGSEDADDFLSTVIWNHTEIDINGTEYYAKIPVTCCKLPGKYPNYGQPFQDNCTTDPSKENSHYQESCYIKMTEYLAYYGILMAGPCGGGVIFEAISLAALIAMCLEIKRKRNRIKEALI